jgi:hypothetical protein
MIVKNVINPEKKGKLNGNIFHIFYPDLHTAIFFDNDLSNPVIFGNKNIVMTWVKKLDELMNVNPTHKVLIYSYIMSPQGYRRIDTYNGPIGTIGKYIRRF